jgi:peptidoglycan/xylan/chitin deacetylase (PgdA/CDA1 family)
MQSAIVYLMYHELEVLGRKVCSLDPGYLRYVVRLSDFAKQMRALKEDGWRGISVGEALLNPASKLVAITFDDGCESDFVAAAPILRSVNFNATFYITAGLVGAQGYLTREQLRELYNLSFEIGCHSMTHAYLPDLNDAALRHEIVDSKSCLEDILGRAVTHFSCPGGRCSGRVKNAVRAAGYCSLATSRPHSNSRSPELYALGRTVVMRSTALPQFEALCRGRGLWKLSLRAGVHHGAMRILGNSFYDRVRGAVLSKVS